MLIKFESIDRDTLFEDLPRPGGNERRCASGSPEISNQQTPHQEVHHFPQCVLFERAAPQAGGAQQGVPSLSQRLCGRGRAKDSAVLPRVSHAMH